MDNRFRNDALTDNLFIRLFTAERRALDRNWNTPNVQSSYWRLYVNAQDGASLVLETGDFDLTAGRVILVPAGVRFDCQCVGPVLHFYIHFDVVGIPGPLLRELFAAPLMAPDSPALTDALNALQLEMARRSLADLGLQCGLKAVVYLALSGAFGGLSAAQRERAAGLTAAYQPVLPAIQHIETHYARALSNAELAALCCLSVNYFIRRFRECVGQSPGQMILERRVRAAAQRLLFTEDSIEQIAEQTGFGNRAYFSRQFARQTGTAPAAYRRASRV